MSWWEGLKIDAIRVARQLWEQTHPNEGKAAPDSYGIRGSGSKRMITG